MNSNPSETLESLAAKARLNPLDYQAHFQLGLKLMFMRNFARAASSLTTAHVREPNDEKVCYWLARALLHIRRYADGERAAKQVTEASSMYPDALALVGLLLEQQEAYPQAHDCYLTAIRRNPLIVEAHAGLTRLMDRGFAERPKKYRAPTANSRVLVDLSDGEVVCECQVRVLSEVSAPNRRIVLLSSYPGVIDQEPTWVRESICSVIETVAMVQRVPAENSRWVLHEAQSAAGVNTLSDIEVKIRPRQSAGTPLFRYHRAIVVGGRVPNPIAASSPTFSPLSHSDFEAQSGYRVQWCH